LTYGDQGDSAQEDPSEIQYEDTIVGSSSKTIGPKPSKSVPGYKPQSPITLTAPVHPKSKSVNSLADIQSDRQRKEKESSASVVFNQDFLKKKAPLRDPPILRRQDAFVFGSREAITVPDNIPTLPMVKDSFDNARRTTSKDCADEQSPQNSNQIEEEPTCISKSNETIDDPAARNSPYRSE
jgi:hypothetical protein